jgi:fimbrial isopeptide formation D2 family protein
MKRTKQIASILLASMMAMSTISMTALADGETAGTTTLSIGSASGDFSLADHTFKAYQILAGKVYTDSTGNTGLSDITWGSAVSDKTADFIEVLQKNASIFGENKEISDSLTAADFAQLVSGLSAENTLKLSVALENVVDANTGVEITGKDGGTLATGGYYLIKDTTADTVQNLTLMLVTSGEENTINVKQSAPTITNEILDNDTGNYGAVSDYQIGDVATFRVTSTVPYTANYSDNYTYTINVKLDAGLEFITSGLSEFVAPTKTGTDEEGYSYEGTNNNCTEHIHIATDEAGNETYEDAMLLLIQQMKRRSRLMLR